MTVARLRSLSLSPPGSAYTETLATADGWAEGRSPGGWGQAGTVSSSAAVIWLTDVSHALTDRQSCCLYLWDVTGWMPNFCVCVVFCVGCGSTSSWTKTPPPTVNNHGGRAGLTCSEAPRARSIHWAPLCLLHRLVEGKGTGVATTINDGSFWSVPARLRCVTLSQSAHHRDADKRIVAD